MTKLPRTRARSPGSQSTVVSGGRRTPKLNGKEGKFRSEDSSIWGGTIKGRSEVLLSGISQKQEGGEIKILRSAIEKKDRDSGKMSRRGWRGSLGNA